MADNSLTLTAAELREIGERVRNPIHVNDIDFAIRDRARLYATVERLIERHLYGDFAVTQVVDKDAAIDALLQGGME